MKLGPNLSVAYREPLVIVRGQMQYLYDDTGRKYLDAYNNVPHVGHCHPDVVEVAAEQMRTLNTNTRYLHQLQNEFAERLSATLPKSLEVCYFLNSASEANELAIRLARVATGRRGVIVQSAAYHGHTTTLIDLSPYKHDGPGGEGTPDWVHKVALPDCYRGEYRGDEEQCGRQYAQLAADVMRAAARAEHSAAAFLAETCPSVGGQIIPPKNYLSLVYQAARNLGVITIADEVQTGYGRLGTHFWAFERFDVTPDIVVMGKPIGNGHPIAAVVTTRDIADCFDNGMEFFSTFGGNTVSCAIGLTVLDVLEKERLQLAALATGRILEEELGRLKSRHAIIGDVRGSGLFWGVELVRDQESLEPAGCEATLIVNRMRKRGILIGTDGPLHNVLKIRPPMPFSQDDARTLVNVLAKILDEEF
jgi:4-aminobutyrate aminotransferase-like enzyme